MIQKLITLPEYPRGFHIITNEILRQLDPLPETGLLFLFIQHTSAGLCINENYDLDVRKDFETIFNDLVPENMSNLRHTLEGPDDMPAHVKSVMTGTSVTIPIKNQRLCLGTWQGVYLCEFRNHGGPRKIMATIST